MTSITYKISFHTYWQCRSGLSAGVEADSIVIKDSLGFPFVPGKTVKGLVRETYSLSGGTKIEQLFGLEGIKEGELFFSNVALPATDVEKFRSKKLGKFLFRQINNIRMENSVTINGSLRRTEVVVPCTLYGYIMSENHLPDDVVERLSTALKLVKRIGGGRNRGYGRCSFEIVKE